MPHEGGYIMRKRDSCKTVEECIRRNTGMDPETFLDTGGPYPICNLDRGVKLLNNAMHKHVFIYIMADYDVDGVMSGSIFELFFRAAHYTNYRIRFPKRFTEGYGIRESVVDEIPPYSLLITVDNGITAIEPVEKAKAKKIAVMIVDHHQPMHLESGDLKLPSADVIIDPHATGGCAFNYYCGAGLAFRLCSRFIREGHPIMERMRGFAAVATIADMVSLTGENRRIVLEGLKSLTVHKNRTTGMEALLQVFGMDRYMTADDIGFYIGPAINAMSRMGDDGAKEAFQAVTFDGDSEKALELAENLRQTNQERKELVASSVNVVERLIRSEHMENDYPMCVYSPSIPEGIIGIVAGNLAEEYHRPALVFSDSGNGEMKGSARTYGDADLYKLLYTCNDLFVRWGGHKEAAGMSVAPDKFPLLKESLSRNFEKLGYSKAIPEETYDLEISMGQLPEIIQEIDRFRPYGNGNPDITLLLKGYRLRFNSFENDYTRRIGRSQNHIKFFGIGCDAVCFGKADEYQECGSPKYMDLLCTVSKSHYIRKSDDELVIKDQLECEDFFPRENQLITDSNIPQRRALQ